MEEMKDTVENLRDLDNLMGSMSQMPDIKVDFEPSTVRRTLIFVAKLHPTLFLCFSQGGEMTSKISKALCGSQSAIKSNPKSEQLLSRRRKRSVTRKSPQRKACHASVQSCSTQEKDCTETIPVMRKN